MDEHGIRAMEAGEVLTVFATSASSCLSAARRTWIYFDASCSHTVTCYLDRRDRHLDHNSRSDSPLDFVLDIQPDRAFNIARHAINVVSPRSPTSLSSVHSGFIEVGPRPSWLSVQLTERWIATDTAFLWFGWGCLVVLQPEEGTRSPTSFGRAYR
jgi:hypothetical protein